MKQLLSFLFAILAIIACSDSAEEIIPEEPQAQPNIKLDVPSLSFPSKGGENAITFSSTESWSAEINSEAKDWCSIDTNSGAAGNAKIIVTLESNETPDNRTASIIIKAGIISKTIEVSQAQKDAIVIAETEYEFGADGGELDFEVQTNVDISVTISDDAKSWITQIETRGMQGKILHFDIESSPENIVRTGYIVLSGGEVNQEIRIHQRLQIPNNQIYYTSTDGSIITPNDSNAFDANIISNVYKDGKGIITFDSNITQIGENAFNHNLHLSSIVIPDKVDIIGRTAFYYCLNLKSVILGNKVEIIGSQAFCNCESLKTINLPFSLKTIQHNAFSGCKNLLEINLPNDIEYIESFAFGHCKELTEVTIPSIINIDGTAFCGCDKLTKFYGDFVSEDNRCVIIDNRLTLFASAGLSEYTIPSYVNHIMNGVFYGCNLKKIIIPEGVTIIDGLAFTGCHRLSSINIPNSIISIGEWAFSNCSNLEQITLPNNVNTIAFGAFYGAGITSITIPDSVTNIGEWAFRECPNLEYATIGDGVSIIGSETFYGCPNLKNVELGNNISEIGPRAFSRCPNLIQINISDGVKIIKEYAFAECTSLETIVIPDSVTILERAICMFCYNLKELSIGNNVSSIGSAAFFGCYKLTSLIIPSNVTYIGSGAFESCININSVYCKPLTPPELDGSIFHPTGSREIYVPRESVDLYKTSWNYYKDHIVGYDFD